MTANGQRVVVDVYDDCEHPITVVMVDKPEELEPDCGTTLYDELNSRVHHREEE